MYNIHKNIILHLLMKFLHLLIFFYLHIFTNSIKINNRIIYNALFKDDFIAKTNTLPIQPKKLFSKGFYSNIKFTGKDERYPENEEVELDKVYENIQNKKYLERSNEIALECLYVFSLILFDKLRATHNSNGNT